MSVYKLLHIFQQAPYGWTEEWFIDFGGSIDDALTVCQQLGTERTKLLSADATLIEAQVSAMPALDTGTIANPGNPFAVRGDSRIGLVTPAKRAIVGGSPDDPWNSLLINLTGYPAGQPDGPFYRRSFHFRGLPVLATFNTTTRRAVVADEALAAMVDFRKKLKALGIGMKGVDKGEPFRPVTAATQALGAVEVVLTSALLVTPSPGAQVTVKGFKRGPNSLNGSHRVVAADADAKTVTIVAPKADVTVTPKSQIALRKQVIVPIQDVAVAPRIAKRDTGASKWVSRAQKRRRPTPTP